MVTKPSTLAVVGFLDRNYRYKSVTIQIAHKTGMAHILTTGRKFLPQRLGNEEARIPYCIVYCIVLMRWSLLTNTLRPFQDLLCSPEFRYY